MNRYGVLQISRLPTGERHVAVVRTCRTWDSATAGAKGQAEDEADHLVTQTAPGGWVGVAPVPGGMVVQLHAADGTIEAWRLFAPALIGGTYGSDTD